jgi:predicted phage terminase large subunit-like protein
MTIGGSMATEQPCSQCEQAFPPVLLIDGVCNPCRFAEEQARIEEAKQLAVQKPRPAKKEFTPSQEAARELARRELCRRHFLPFVQRFNPDYLAGWVHVDICERLEQFERDVAAKKSPRLMIFMPPRHGKSQLTSKSYPAWVLGHHPEWEFISCSYSSSLANRFSRALRAIMRDERYHSVFKTRLDPDTQSVELWETTEGGGLLAAGVGGPITGSGANILLIDDPLKNREEAESPGIREGIWDWYSSTAYTRLAPGGGVLVIQTRWHDDDLSGRLIRAMLEGDGDQWEIVEYPAIALEDEPFRKAGEPLHPERYDLNALDRIRRVISDRDWWALYQQKPISDEGAYFTREMFDFYHEGQRPRDDELTFYDAWDLAIGQRDHNDWTVGLSAGLDRNGDLWLVARDRGKYDGSQLVEHIIDFHLERRSQITGVERGMIEMSIGPFLDRRIAERKAWSLFVEPLKTRGRDKVARARAIQGMAKQGKVHLPHPHECDWIEEFMGELLRFPAGAHDDQVDAFAWLGQMIAEMSPASLPTPPKVKTWKDRLEGFVVNGRRKSFMAA